MTIRRWKIQIGIGLVGVPAVLFAVGSVCAQQCSSKTTEGRYLITCDGYLVPAPNSPLVPAKILATATADDNGTFRSSDSRLIVGGTLLHQAIVGTEVLNPDCTGTIAYAQTINGQTAPPIHFAFVVSNNGEKIDGLGTDPGTVLSCHLTRITSVE
jgi:hypothetical protein